ncbi:DNA repair protein RecO (recombination protein O) [Pedobacter cryoconitis]|uniref:DNA repair protein RecO n=1 Tax=Pedobacter cryoconitis TaxID=188932 RepID=UPI00161C4D46|nr:DNA repair protein RecO [Pedobacter cryoconitis]MBB6273195.1 DNA repair protein RecO (recombination protein O) [Pedobacter cryoconitis]
MLHKTRGIVLKTTLYSENSVVVQIFTAKFGIQSYMVNGVKKPKAKIKMNMLQALHLVDMVVYHKTNSSIQRISELRPSPVFRTIPYDIIKSTITIFLNEVLYKSIRQQHADENIFDYIFNAISWFDETDQASANFHLAFLLKLSRFLGFAPSLETKSDQSYFDLQEGEFKSLTPVHPYFIEKTAAELFILLFTTPFEKLNEIKIDNTTRRLILDKILIYYTLHTASFGEIKSHQILEEILS